MVVAFVVMQSLNSMGMLGSSVRGFLVPICVYISLAVSLNLLVGVCGELSLGHAGFQLRPGLSGSHLCVHLPGGVAEPAGGRVR